MLKLTIETKKKKLGLSVKNISLPPWLYGGKEINDISDFPEYAYGFIYVITYIDGTKYIGKKNLYRDYTMTRHRKRKDLSGREVIAPVLKRNKLTHRVEEVDLIRDSRGWKNYVGSSKEAKERMNDIVSREILEVARTKRELTYLEAKFLFIYNAIEDPMYINRNILNKFFRGNLV